MQELNFLVIMICAVCICILFFGIRSFSNSTQLKDKQEKREEMIKQRIKRYDDNEFVSDYFGESFKGLDDEDLENKQNQKAPQ